MFVRIFYLLFFVPTIWCFRAIRVRANHLLFVIF